MKKRLKQKVFGIGFHKTGTTSLALALEELGYRVTGPNWIDDRKLEERMHKDLDSVIAKYDAFQDNPWPLLYKHLDESYPNSKFILTVRPTDKWIGSVLRHFGEVATPMREWIYGVGYPKGNEEIYISRYEQHNREVVDYFVNRDEDLLVLNLTEGEGWDKLCPFLGLEVPSRPFPRANDANVREGESRFGGMVRKKLKRLKKKLRD